MTKAFHQSLIKPFMALLWESFMNGLFKTEVLMNRMNLAKVAIQQAKSFGKELKA